MFPTHRLGPPRYINGRPSIFGDTFLFLLLLLSYTFFLTARDNETIRDRLTSWKSPRAWRVSHFSFCVLKNCRHSHRQALSLYLWRAATISTARCHQLPHLTHRARLSVFSNFQTLLAAFFHNRYILTNLATFLKKLSYRSVGRCLQYCPASMSSDSPGAVSPLSASILCSERQWSSALIWP